MLTGHKDPGVVAAEVKMCRTLHKGAFLVVEGVDDARFWRPRKHETCELIIGEGKPNVLGCIQKLDEEHFFGALGLVDNDYDILVGTKLDSKNLVSTDAHDLECMLCRSTALDTALAEFGDPTKIRRFEKNSRQDTRTELLERAAEFGRIRCAALRSEFGTEIKNLRIPRFVKEVDWSIDFNLAVEVVATSEAAAVGLKNEIDRLPTLDPWHVSQGHDMIEILRIGLKRVLGNIAPSIGTNSISGILRAAMPLEELKSTQMGTEIESWETGNPSFRVLSD